ncbi:MAG: chemotaxis protein CheW, partial [Leptospiraceae bacterium]|nr:chemotaxis protein CheW [Leptospiraceae bacterium]
HDDIEKYLNTIKLKYTKIVYLHTKPKPQVNAQSTEGYRNTFLKISTSYIDELLNVAGEAVIARNQLLEILNYEEDSEEEIRINRLSQYINVIYNRLMKIRLLKIGSIYPRLQRIIRDVSKELNKEIQAEFYGNEIEFDEAMMEGITEALMHILRNSIDHGIENKEERIRNNKPAFGKIILNTYLQRGNIFIQVRDDGRGIDLDKIKDKALRENLYTFEQLEAMQDSEIYELIFHPGFTTRKEATSISGRGVGMDIVLNNFKKYGGSVRVESEKGKGVCITGIIPQTLSVMPAFIILVNDKKFAIMQKNILELTKYDAANIIELDDKKIYKLRNQKIPLIELNNVLFPNYMVHEKNENIAILQSENKYFAISFNSLVSIEEIVLKPLPEQVRDVNLFGGHTYSGDGSIILIIEPDAILKKFNLKVELKEGLVKKEESKNKRDHNYLFFIISDEIFFLPAVNIVGVREIGLSNIKQVLGKEKVYIEEKIITIIRIEKYLNIRKQNDIPKMYCIELKNEEYSIGIIAHDILDILEGIETYKSQDIYNQYISAYSKIEDSIALHIDIEKVVQKFIEEEISI